MIKFKDTRINEIELVKYGAWCESYFKHLERKPILLSSVKNAAEYYSEESEEQGYVLRLNNEIVGLIHIGLSCDEKDLEVELEYTKFNFDEKRIWTERIVNGLERLNTDKRSVYVCVHDVKLTFSPVVTRFFTFAKTSNYTKENIYHRIVKRVVGEMKSYEEAFMKAKYWTQTMTLKPQYKNDGDLEDAITDNLMSPEQLFNYVDKIAWLNINGSKKYVEHIGFGCDGEVCYKRELCGHKAYKNYTTFQVKYSVANPTYGLKAVKVSGNKRLKFISNSGALVNDTYVNENLHIQTRFKPGKDTKRSFDTCRNGIDTKTSINLGFNESGGFDHFHMDLDTYRHHRHHGRSRVNGTYMLRIRRYVKGTIKVEFYFVHRDGRHNNMLELIDSSYYPTTNDENTLMVIQELVKQIISLVNSKEHDRGYIFLEPMSIDEMLSLASEVDNITKDIQDQIDGQLIKDYIADNNIDASNVKQKIYK